MQQQHLLVFEKINYQMLSDTCLSQLLLILFATWVSKRVCRAERPLGVFHVVVLYFFPSGVRMNMKLLLLLHSPTTHSNVIVLHVVICLNRRGEGVRERERVSKCRLCFCVCVYGKFDTWTCFVALYCCFCILVVLLVMPCNSCCTLSFIIKRS